MERALWNEKEYIASDIAEDYDLEKNIRQVSGEKLLCPDPDCRKPLIYCNGTKYRAHFRHKTVKGTPCDYAKYDKETSQTKHHVKKVLYETFKSKGYEVTPEVKLLPHHYTHLLFSFSDEKKVAVEFITDSTSDDKKYINLSQEYKEAGIEVQWILISNYNPLESQYRLSFKANFFLNENKGKDIIIINEAGTKVTQCIKDPNTYTFKDTSLNWLPLDSITYPEKFFDYEDYYPETKPIEKLSIACFNITIPGFHERYRNWLIKKRKAHERRERILAERKKEYEEKKEKEEKERQEKIKQQKAEAYKRQNPFNEQASTEIQQNSLFSRQSPQYNPNVIKTKYCRICRQIYPIEEFRNIFEDIGIYDFGECRYCIEFQEEQEKERERTKLNS